MTTQNTQLNPQKIHTTPLGVERIRRNLGLQDCAVVDWCKGIVANADLVQQKGKNWYVYGSGAVITINIKSNTIITAHKIKARVRTIQEQDYYCLEEFLYQAIYIPEGEELPPRSIVTKDPEIYIYIKDFGTKAGDIGVVAECSYSRQIIGAAWARIIPAYGNLDNETPELATALLPQFRRHVIGSAMLKKLFVLLKEKGFTKTSLSVQKNNPAVEFYKRLGYKIVGERLDHAGHEDYLMVKELG